MKQKTLQVGPKDIHRRVDLPVGGIAVEREMRLGQACAQGRITRQIDVDAITLRPAGEAGVPFEHKHLQPRASQAGCGAKPSQSRSSDDYIGIAHVF